MKCCPLPDNPGMDHPTPLIEPENQDAPSLPQVTEARTGKGGKTPSLVVSGKDKKPTREQRNAANRAKRDAVTLQEYARAEVPAGIRIASGLASAAGGSESENQPAPSLPGVSLLLTAQQRKDELSRTNSSVIGKSILPRGRPSEYTDDEADSVCEWVGEGGSLKAYCRTTGRSMKTVYAWMRENASFLARYSRACEDRADTLSDEGLEKVDDCAINPTIEGVAAAKLQWEARKWIASKLRPQKWGDKQVVEHVGAVSIRIGIASKPPLNVLENVEEVHALPAKRGPAS